MPVEETSSNYNRNTMVNRLLFFCFFLASCLLVQTGMAQCTGGNNGGAITPTAAWQSVNNIAGNSYRTFVATAGSTYYFSFCAADGGSSNFDTQLTINTNAGVAVPGAYNDDFCGHNPTLPGPVLLPVPTGFCLPNSIVPIRTTWVTYATEWELP